MKSSFNTFISNKMFLLSNHKNIYTIPLLKKIILHISHKNIAFNSKKIILSYLALNLISQSTPFLIKSKKSIMILKIREGMFVSCKVTLRKKKMFFFLNKFILINTFKINYNWTSKKESLSKDSITLRLTDLYYFSELEKFFDFFDTLPFLGITFVTSKFNQNKSFKFFRTLNIV